MFQSNRLALLPILCFLVLFVGGGLYFTIQNIDHPFYQISPTVAILPALVLAILVGKGTIIEKLDVFMEGVGHRNITTMCMIYLLAGAFTNSAEAIGGVQSTVNLALEFIPDGYILPGIFLITSFISLSIGTSMGTIAAISPIAIGLASAADLPLSLTMGAVIGGAMFGDNLSMISDTTIAAVQSQGCTMVGRFKFNVRLAIPAMVFTTLILATTSIPHETIHPQDPYHLLHVLPYLAILGLAILGYNVMVALMLGIMAVGIIGLATVSDYTMLIFAKSIYAGYASMQEILILSLLIGGLSHLTKQQGGIAYLIHLIEKISARFSRKQHSQRAGEFAISTIVSLADICTANNTVSIILTGEAAREIAKRNHVDPARSASMLDIFSCVFQGILPYSAQVLLAASIAKISPFSVIPYIHYSYILGGIAVLSIIFRYPRRVTS
jgi:Na+/H+ antiporter NhaC